VCIHNVTTKTSQVSDRDTHISCTEKIEPDLRNTDLEYSHL